MRKRRNLLLAIGLAMTTLLLVLTAGSLAKSLRDSAGPLPITTLLTFEEFPGGTVVTNQYGARGVSFRGALIISETTARSGDRVLYSGNPVDEFNPGPLIIDFASSQRYVKVFAGTVHSQISAVLTAYDAAGAVLVRDGPRIVATGQLSTIMQVTAASAQIRRVELLYTPNTFEIIDDLEFDGDAPPPVPSTAPVVVITAPAPVCKLCRAPQATQASFTVQGTVTGAQLASQAVIKMQVVRPPGSSVTSLFTYPVTLTGSGRTRTFSHPVTLGLGSTTFTVEAENAGGLRGQASSSIFYLPQPIRDRLRQTGSLGTFVFGGGPSPTPACTYAVYANGAVAMVNNQTFLIRGGILTKWLSLTDALGRYPRFGCPVGEERDVVSAVTSNGQQIFDGKAQNFPGARVYSHTRGAFFVPPVFAEMIDSLGGEPATGLPVSDPTSDSRPTFKTWMFQQYRRPGVDIPSTLEIRGDPPKLFVQRQGGGTEFAGVRRPRNPTIVEIYDCASTSGPCPYIPPDSTPFAALPVCNNETFNWEELAANLASLDTYKPNPPEWAPIFGQYDQTKVWGVVYSAQRAETDNPFAHEHRFEPCGPATLLVKCIRGEVKCCPSDWDVKIRPLPAYRWMQAAQRDHIAIEWEQVHGHSFMVGFGFPIPGDGVFASGRFIADCGHAPIKTEIHPPSVLAVVGTVTHRGAPATEANIWVNAFFTGGTDPRDVVEFEVYPPPRPSPKATLGALFPTDPAIRVQVTFSNVSLLGPVKVRVTAPRREPKVTNLGEMKWPTDGIPGGFQGRLLVFWNP